MSSSAAVPQSVPAEPGTGPELVAAVDIGGTKTAAALVDAAGTLVARTQRPTPATAPAEAVLGAVLDAVEELAAHPRWSAAAALGIGSAGPVDAAAGTVSPVNIAAWRGFPLVERVAGHPAVGVPVALLGDGVAIAEAEAWRGAAAGYRNALCMVVSTGVGGGLVLDGAVYAGPSGNAGHIGHITVGMDGPPCPCGSRGCVEVYASGTAIARYAAEQGLRPPDGDTTAAAVATAALAGDGVALAAYDRAARALAAGIAATATLVELEAVVIGGGVAQSGPVLFDPLARHLASYAALPFTHGIRLHHARLGTDAGLVGAAAAAMRLAGAPGPRTGK
ncbi:ROK family protein [Kitasatospora sp. NPDC051914]|uniref:ROK family protein n=1 Tax=Kitasatospora sp. NPDC051914 TaxID=3154945 RepID=UPI003414740B